MSLLSVRDVFKSFGGVRAVDGVSLELQRGEILALIGPNGAGKSTFFNMLHGQIPPDAGSVAVEGRTVSGLKPREMFHLGVSRTFQNAATFTSMTVRENVQMVLLSRDRQLGNVYSRAETMAEKEAMHWLAQTGMADQSARPVCTLAYGDVKRVELAMALASRPKLLLMDEPTAGMAATERGELMSSVAKIAARENIGVLFTEHSMDVVFAHAHRVAVLSRGKVIAEGSPGTVRDDPVVREIYFGDSKLNVGRRFQ
jgi:branched-chain amino acid transport system ATP-binding protein